MDSSDKEILSIKQPESAVMRTSKLIFVICMALASPFVAMACLIALAAIGGAIFGITLLVTHVENSGLVLLALFGISAIAYTLSGRSQLKLLRKRIVGLEAELTETRIQIKEIEHGAAFDKRLQSDKGD
jgi:hypothetical protein